MMYIKMTNLASIFTLVTTMLVMPVVADAADGGVGLVGQLNRGAQLGENSNKTSMSPFIYYDGDNIYADFQEVSWKMIKQPHYTISPLLSFRLRGYDPEQDVELAGMDSRDATIEAGARIQMDSQLGVMSFTAVTDTLNKHNGYELKASWGATYQRFRWSFDAAVGISHKSDAMVDYYYGVRPDEATVERQAYTAGAATNPYLELNMAYILSRKIILISGMEFSWLDDAIQDSPIIERSTENAIYSGMLYKF